MTGDRIGAAVLALRVIPSIDPRLAATLDLKPGERSIGFFTSDCDDVGYTACDEATKKAAVRVAYAKSFYAGAGNASTRFAGEFIGILAGEDPESIKSGLAAARQVVEAEAAFYSANEDDSVVYYAHCISRSGSFLSASAGIPGGESLAYLIAPPLEAIFALDQALKATDTELVVSYPPPSETNFAGGLLHGSQSSCREACEVFAEAVRRAAAQPIEFIGGT